MAVDPAAVARVKAALDADPDVTVIATALKQTTLNLRSIAAEVIKISPWTVIAAGRWRHSRGDNVLQLLAGTAGVKLAEMTDNGDGSVTAFLYLTNPAVDPATNVGSPLDGTSAVETKRGPIPNTTAAAWNYLESSVTAGHLL
jgi:hypothetical protein